MHFGILTYLSLLTALALVSYRAQFFLFLFFFLSPVYMRLLLNGYGCQTYIPLFLLIMRFIYQQGRIPLASNIYIDGKLDSPIRRGPASEKVRQNMKRTVQYTLSVLISILVHFPVLTLLVSWFVLLLIAYGYLPIFSSLFVFLIFGHLNLSCTIHILRHALTRVSLLFRNTGPSVVSWSVLSSSILYLCVDRFMFLCILMTPNLRINSRAYMHPLQ